MGSVPSTLGRARFAKRFERTHSLASNLVAGVHHTNCKFTPEFAEKESEWQETALGLVASPSR